MFRTILILIALIVTGIYDHHALAAYGSSYFIAFMVLLFPFLLLSFLISVLQLTGWVNSTRLSNVKAVVFSVFFALVVIEGLLRITKTNATYLEGIGHYQYRSSYWPDKKNSFWHLFPPNDSMSFFRGEFPYFRLSNSMGLAEREVDLKDTTTKKILCMGDSFTEGIGTSADSSWPRVVERCFNRCSKDSFLVYDAGVGGADPMYNYHLLRNRLWDVKWDAVVFCVNGTDVPEVIIRGGMERFKKDTVEFTKPPVWEPLYASLFLVRFYVLKILHYNWTFHSQDDLHRLNMDAAGKLSAMLLHAHDELSQRGIKMMVIFHPMTYDIQQHEYTEEGIDTLIQAIAPLKPVNLLPYYLDSIGVNEKNYSRYYWPKDGHFKGVGYNIMGRKVARELMGRMGLQCEK